VSVVKLIHVLDAATDIAALTFRLADVAGDDRVAQSILRRGGFPGGDYVILCRLGDGLFEAHWDPFAWVDLTMTAAHLWLLEHFDEAEHGGVVNAQPTRMRLAAA